MIFDLLFIIMGVMYMYFAIKYIPFIKVYIKTMSSNDDRIGLIPLIAMEIILLLNAIILITRDASRFLAPFIFSILISVSFLYKWRSLLKKEQYEKTSARRFHLTMGILMILYSVVLLIYMIFVQ